MKKLKLLSAGIVLCLLSCSKDGTIGPKGATGATGTAGVSGITTTVITMTASNWFYSPNLKCYYQYVADPNYNNPNDMVIINFQNAGGNPPNLPVSGWLVPGDTLTYTTLISSVNNIQIMYYSNGGKAPSNTFNIDVCVIPN